MIAEKSCFVVYRYVSPNIDQITGTLRLNGFDIADSLCCMFLTDRFPQLLRCEVALHFINTSDINDSTLNYYWEHLTLVTYVSRILFIRVALYLTVTLYTCSTSCP